MSPLQILDAQIEAMETEHRIRMETLRRIREALAGSQQEAPASPPPRRVQSPRSNGHVAERLTLEVEEDRQGRPPADINPEASRSVGQEEAEERARRIPEHRERITNALRAIEIAKLIATHGPLRRGKIQLLLGVSDVTVGAAFTARPELFERGKGWEWHLTPLGHQEATEKSDEE